MDPGLLLEVVRLHLFEALRDIQARLSNRLARAVLELCSGGPLPELPRPRCLSGVSPQGRVPRGPDAQRGQQPGRGPAR